VRIHHAKRLLAMPEYNYNQIMEATGYTYQSYFIRMFKRVTGTTPQKFRMRKQGSQQVSVKCKRKQIL
jgi:YesN/AraC family two-component response regulator